MFEVAVMAGVEEHDDGHDLAEGQVPLADAVPLAILEQALHIQGFKPLAKIINIAEHGNQLAHRDLRRVQTASWSIQPPYAAPYGLTSPSRLSRIQVSKSRGAYSTDVCHPVHGKVVHGHFW